MPSIYFRDVLVFLNFCKILVSTRFLWRMCPVVFHALTLELPIQTSLSVAPELPVYLSSAEKCEKVSETSTPQVNFILKIPSDHLVRYTFNLNSLYQCVTHELSDKRLRILSFAYDFGNHEHSVFTNELFSLGKEDIWMASVFKKFGYKEQLLLLLRAYSQRWKAEANAKNIKEMRKRFKKKINMKKNFRFRLPFCSVWKGLYNDQIFMNAKRKCN